MPNEVRVRALRLRFDCSDFLIDLLDKSRYAACFQFGDLGSLIQFCRLILLFRDCPPYGLNVTSLQRNAASLCQHLIHWNTANGAYPNKTLAYVELTMACFAAEAFGFDTLPIRIGLLRLPSLDPSCTLCVEVSKPDKERTDVGRLRRLAARHALQSNAALRAGASASVRAQVRIWSTPRIDRVTLLCRIRSPKHALVLSRFGAAPLIA